MELMQTNQNALDFQINGNTAKLVGIIQTMVTGSFAKKYGNTNIADVVSVFGVLTSDLSNEQINQGLNTVLEMGYCPDVALFRRWCLGLKGFDNADHIADSYIGKTGALANVLAWLDDDTRSITVAEKTAYDKCYHVFEQAHRLPSLMITAHVAFMDNYDMVVRELVANRQPCQVWQAPVALEHHETVKHHEPSPNTFNLGGNNWVQSFGGYTPSQSFAIVQKLKRQGETMGQAYQRIWANGVENSLPSGVSLDNLIGGRNTPKMPMMAFGVNKMDYLGEVA